MKASSVYLVSFRENITLKKQVGFWSLVRIGIGISMPTWQVLSFVRQDDKNGPLIVLQSGLMSKKLWIRILVAKFWRAGLKR